MAEPPSGGSIGRLGNFVGAILFPFYRSYSALLGEWSITTLYGVFIWSTLMGIVWLGVFSISVIIANVSMNLSGLGPWLDRNFRVRSQPFRILELLALIWIIAAWAIYHALV
jgi:hypothetical protein